MSILNYVFGNGRVSRDDLRATRDRLTKMGQFQAKANVKKGAQISAMEDHIRELAILSRTLVAYIAAQPGFDAQEFDAIVATIHADDEQERRAQDEVGKPATVVTPPDALKPPFPAETPVATQRVPQRRF